MNRLFPHLPNLLTALRIAAAPALALLTLEGSYGQAFAVFLFAGASDAADGYLAKRFGLSTRFGRIFDPAADKILMLLSFLALVAIGVAPVWLAALVIGRDALIVLGVGLAWALDLPMPIAPLPLGKATTVAQIAYIALILMFLVTGFSAPQTAAGMAIAVAVVTLASGLNYAALWLRAVVIRAGRTA